MTATPAAALAEAATDTERVMAKAIVAAVGAGIEARENGTLSTPETGMASVRAALAALHAAGWALVPVMPTLAMCEASTKVKNWDGYPAIEETTAAVVWDAMLAARPK